MSNRIRKIAKQCIQRIDFDIMKEYVSKAVYDYYNQSLEQKTFIEMYKQIWSNKYEQILGLILFNRAKETGVKVEEVEDNFCNFFDDRLKEFIDLVDKCEFEYKN